MEDLRAVITVLHLIACVVHFSSADTHTLQYLYTALTPGTHFPNFTAVGLVDGEQVVYYDSNTKKMIPKTEWMEKIKVNDQRYWDSETRYMEDQQDSFNVIVYRAKQRFNHNEGDHTVQRMYGCELDDDGTTRGYDQYAYDGEDFISLDLTTGTWTAANDQAKSFINDWDSRGTEAKYWKDFLKTDCVAQLKKFVSYGRETLKSKVQPKVTVFQKHSPSPEVVCHATGFFPKPLNITWQKDGEDVHEDVVEIRETLPNQDGSFQKRSILKVPAEELQKHKYTCVVQHSSLEKELVREVPKGGAPIAVFIAVVAALVALVALVIVVAGIVVWKKKKSGERRKDVKFSKNRSRNLCCPQTSTNRDSPSNNCQGDAGYLPAEQTQRHKETEEEEQL